MFIALLIMWGASAGGAGAATWLGICAAAGRSGFC